LVSALLDEFRIDKELAPALALHSAKPEVPDLDHPKRLLHHFRVAGWIEEFQRKVPEVGHLVYFALMYKLAFKLAIEDKPWRLPPGRIITPASASVVLKFSEWHMNAMGAYEFWFDVQCCTKPMMGPTKKSRDHSAVSQLQKSVQVQSGEDPETQPFTEGQRARERQHACVRIHTLRAVVALAARRFSALRAGAADV
jgi:hypothetical protein